MTVTVFHWLQTITEGETLDLGRIKYEHIPGFEFAHYAYSDVINANDGVTYNTSNSDVATVNSNGVVSAKYKRNIRSDNN